MNSPSNFKHGDMVMICGAGPGFDCSSIMVEGVLYAQKANSHGKPISIMGWWYLWNKFYPYPVSEEHVFPVGDDHKPTWDDCVWSPSKQVEKNDES